MHNQNDHLKGKSKFLCIQSLVLEVKGFKQGYIFKNRPFYISCVLFNTQEKKVFTKKEKKIVSFPTLFFAECYLDHTYFFIWPYQL